MTKKKNAPPAHNCQPPAHSCHPPAHSCHPPVNNCSSLTCDQIEADAEISFAFFRNEGFPQIDSDDFEDEYLLQDMDMSNTYNGNIENNGTMQKEAMPNSTKADPNIYETCLKAARKSKRKKKQKTNQEQPLNVDKETEIQIYNTEHVLEETNQWLAQIRSQNQNANVDNTPEENNKSKTAKGSEIKTNGTNGREDKKASMKENVAGNESLTGRMDKKHVENNMNQKMKEESTRQQNNTLNQMTDFQNMMAYTREGFPGYWPNVEQSHQPPVYTLFGPQSNHHEVGPTRGAGSLLKDLEVLMEPALTAQLQPYAPKTKPFQIQTNWRREQLLNFDDGQTGNRPCGCNKRKQPGGGQPGNPYMNSDPFPRCCEQFQARACFNSTAFCPPTKDIPPSNVTPGQHNCPSPTIEYFATVPGQDVGCPCGWSEDVGCPCGWSEDVGCPCGWSEDVGCPCGCSESILCTQTPCPYHDRMACEILAKYGITDLKLDDTPYEPYEE